MTEREDTLKVEGDRKSSRAILDAISKAQDHFNGWQALCDRIDDVYSRQEHIDSEWLDPDYDLFWASTEILKPSIYARPPVPVVAPMFNDRRRLYVTTAQLLERAVMSVFEHGDLDAAMLCTRDDLIFYNRGQIWITLDGDQVVVEHLDRKDFLHPPARKWEELPWVGRRAWMSRKEMRERFSKHSGDAYKSATLQTKEGEQKEHAGKAGVWEIWHKADNRVYWVAEGCNEILDQGKPHLDLERFFPCPRPAYGTLRLRTLEPIPDYTRYAGHFRKINSLTKRIYKLLDRVQMKGLVPAGGDVGQAVEQLLAQDSDSTLLIPVPGALLQSGANNFVQWLPLAELAQAIQGLIEARRELFSDYDRLSGISDIMRGETEAQETLGAQQLKGQYGSVRVRERSDEMVRIARDATRIVAEIMAENIGMDKLLEMAQMELRKASEIKKDIGEIETSAERELREIGERAQAQPDMAQFEQAQQAVLQKYAPQLKKLSDEVSYEDARKLLRDEKARNFAFEIETDSTILSDEQAAKQQAADFYAAFTGGMQGLMGAAGMGGEALTAAVEVLKYTLSPYRPPRSVLAAIDDMLDAAPQIAERIAAQNEGGDGEDEGSKALAEAEMAKAQAQAAKVQADAQLKMQELEFRATEAQAKAQQDQQRFALEVEDTKGKLEETAARIEKIYADIQLAQQKMGVEVHRERREDAKFVADVEARAVDQELTARRDATAAVVKAQQPRKETT